MHGAGVEVLRVESLLECEVLRRVNRFAVATLVRGREEIAHITNTGRLEDHLTWGRRGLCARIRGTKLAYRLVAVEELKGLFAIVDTLTQQKAFEAMVNLAYLPWLEGCTIKRRNPKVFGEVVDYELGCPSGTRLAELKSAVLRLNDLYASYPDCPSERGRRQVAALVRLSTSVNPLLVFVAALPEVKAFRPFCERDPRLAEVLREAVSRGLEVRAIGIHMEHDGRIILDNPNLPVSLEC